MTYEQRPGRWLHRLPLPAPADALLMDVARRVQLSPTKHGEAEKHYHALCNWVDRSGSPLEGKVVTCYPGGSFATGTAIASRVKKDQHDVDVTIELDISPSSDPATILDQLFKAINGEEGTRYRGMVTRNSRCVTVTYDDGVRVDLMPIARLTGHPERAGHLFHWREENAESYHKPVNPWGFADLFNRETAFDPVFAAMFDARGLTMDGAFAKADTEPLPEQVPLSEKSARVVALQLIKRNRDVRYRHRQGRKPPSVVLAALALEVAPTGGGLADEVISIASYISTRLRDEGRSGRLLTVTNPSYVPDVFTDRWPAKIDEQSLYVQDLAHLSRQLRRLQEADISLTEMKLILDDLFGETAASFALDELLTRSQAEAEKGALRFGSTGRIVTAAAPTVVSAISTPARASTQMGGGCIPD
ncbi:hypothetical protein N6H05_02380 [Sphingobium sp. WTD-1]|jgi:hypothetical protein|uniref:nucleotidyltransferase domain-containing protein n=1 Tax=Sphingobium TaxID=165695 RepID=UPI0024DF04EE|nr:MULTISPECIES: hypothetical protein [Sphingobium]WIA56689.1 hypothetical protein N6H05_02380 [Sphingobium sp. WTD-1]